MLIQCTKPMNKLSIYLYLTILFTVATSCEQSVKSDNWEQERLRRISLDFNKTEEQTYKQLQQYYPAITEQEMEEWEKSNTLEHRIIDGEKRYFHSAARNLFITQGRQSNSLDIFLQSHIPTIVAAAKSGTPQKPINFKIKYTLTVDADAVPSGEVVKAWMPFVRKDPKNSNIKLISTSEPEYTIADEKYAHKSIYMEKVAEAGKPTIFEYIFSYDSRSEWFDFKAEDVKPYDTESELYKKFTAERENHVIFSDRIKTLTDSIVGSETNPYLKSKAIFHWIYNNFPWASAREYSTIRNIPEYVLDIKHGDCGQVSLLFITMARCAGIPAKWQSGWMLHPGEVNLHDWAEVYYEGIGWVPVDQSFGLTKSDDEDVVNFFTKGLDAYRLIVNDDFSQEFYPAKTHYRSETVDFQRGEVEWEGGNVYFNQWDYNLSFVD